MSKILLTVVVLKSQIFLLLLLFTVSEISAQQIRTTIISKNEKEFTIQFSADIPLPAIYFCLNTKFTAYSYNNTGKLTEAGLPGLPVWIKYIKIPPGYSIHLEKKYLKTLFIENILPYPYQRPLKRNQSQNPEFYYDSVFYKGNSIYPAKHFYIKRIFRLGNNQFAELHFVPLIYSAGTQTIEFARELKLEVSFSKVSRSGENQIDGPMLITDNLGNRFDFRALFEGKAVAVNPPKLLIIAHDKFYETMQPFVAWKNLSGIRTHMIKLSDIGANPAPEQIRDYIKTSCTDTLTGQIKYDHLLLVGDVAFIPAFHGVRDALNDHSYSLLNDGDFFPDIFVGRFSVNTVEECRKYVEKTIKYEKYPQVELTDNWFNKASVIASSSYSDDAHGRHLVSFMNKNRFSVVDDLRASRGKFTNYNILDALNKGRSWVFYIGHGDNNGWNTLGTFNIYFLEHNLNNYFQYPAIVSVACSNADLDRSSPSFAEVWMNYSKEKGAIIFIGATEDTPFYLSDTLGKYALMSYISGQTLTMGEALVYGKLKMNACFPENNFRETEETMQHFLILGDPTLAPWTDIPQYLSVDFPQFLKRGNHSLRIHVANAEANVPNALVCLSHADNSYFKTAYTDSAGNANFSIDGNDSGYFRVSVTGRNLNPFVDSFLVSDASSLNENRQDKLSVFPNPTTSTATFIWSAKSTGRVSSFRQDMIMEFRLYSITGKLIRQEQFTGNSYEFTKGKLPEGLYIYTLQGGTLNFVGKLMIE